MLGGVKGFVSMASSRRPSRRSARRIAPPLRPFSRVRVARPSVHSLPLRSVWSGRLCPPFRFNFPFRVPPRVFDPGRFPVYPPTDLLQVCRTVACVHGTRSALAAGQVLTAAARSSAPPSPPTPRALPRRPSQHPAHRCPRLRPPHCPCFCCQLCGTCGVFPFLAPSCPPRRHLRALLCATLTRSACLRRSTVGQLYQCLRCRQL